MASRTSDLELARVRAALIHSAELLAIESLAVLLFTPLSVATLLTHVGPILARLQQLIQACNQALFGYASVENQLIGEFRDLRVSPSEELAGSLVASGLLASGAVWVKASGATNTVVAASSFAEITSRLRELSDRREPLVRIEKYVGSAGNRFIVYVPGTQNLGLPNSNPLDMRSNLRLMAGVGSASSRAVDMALRKAGAGPDDRVMLVGYSQGGMVAAQLGKEAKSGSLGYLVDEVVTFGSPVGSYSAESLPRVLSVENEADFVPHLDTISNPKTQNWLTLEGVVSVDAVKNHEMESYQQIVAKYESSGELEGNQVVRGVESFAVGTGTVGYFAIGQKVP
jgi:hypothetical protein